MDARKVENKAGGRDSVKTMREMGLDIVEEHFGVASSTIAINKTITR
jgi:hypothetical protein